MDYSYDKMAIDDYESLRDDNKILRQELKKALGLIIMHDNKKRKVMETFRNAKKKRNLLLASFEDFTKQHGVYSKWIKYRKSHSLKNKYMSLDMGNNHE